MSDPTPGSGLGTAGAHPTTEPISPGVRNLAGINPNIPAPPSSASNSGTIDGGASHSDPKADSHAQSASRQSSLTPLPDLPEAPPSRMVGGGYNATSHTIPTVSAYKQQQEEWSQQADEYARIVAQRAQETEERRARAEEYAKESGGAAQSGDNGKHGGEFDKKETMGEKLEESNSRTAGNVVQSAKDKKDKVDPNKPATEKQRMMDQMNAHKMKPTERLNKAEKGQRRVRDPTTGGEIIIRDADPKDFDHTYPRANGTNILYHPFPAPQPPSVNSLLSKLRFLQFGVGGGLFVLWLSVAFGSGFWRFAWRSVLCAGTAFGIMTAISLVERGMEKELEAVRLDMHRQRGVAFSPPAPESVEWLNGLIKLVWGLLDPAFFVSIADMVEDILQQSLPGFIDAVRISDLSQGTNPLRILSIRALPDQPGDEGYPKTGWINEGNSDVKSTDPMKGEEFKEDDAGDYYNFEVAFSYSALPGQGSKARSKNIHLLIQFFIGMYDWLHIPVPIWIQVEQIFGIVRLRVQFIPEFPYVRNLTFALCGVPAVEVSAIPMSKHLPNILDLPFISSFVKMGIAAGTAELCVPKSMTLNLQELLSGAAVGDTRAVGVFVITIHHCEGLSAQDRNGLSDPYVILAYAKFGKPLYSTRIILGDLNPVFEETCVLMLTEDEIKAKEDLSAMLWDSDKMSADDLVGRVQIPVAELMQKPNEMVRREDSLTGFEDADDMPGKLVWSIGYFTKVPLEKDLERAPTVEESKNQPEPSKTAPEMEMLPHDAAPNPAKKDIPPPPPDVQKTRPNPAWPSGVLSVILHQINNLERQDLKGNSGEREGEAGQDTDEPSEQSDNLPSGYGEIIVNDEMVYKTRVKQYTTMPYFEAGTEVFVRDYRDTVVRVVIRDSRLREADPILGIVSVRLSEIFAESSSVTQVYAITEGIGFGKANISFAFRGMHVTLPRNMRGWDTGTLEVYNARFDIEPGKEDRFAPGPAQLRVVTAEKVEQFPKKECTVEGNSITWELESNEDVDGDGDTDAVKPLRMPIYSRYSSAVEFVIRKGALGVGPLVKLGIKLDPAAIAMLWLQDLTDDVEQEVRLPVLVSKDYVQLRQNVINDQTAKHHDFEVIGWLTARMKLDSGLDEDHEDLRLKQSRRHALEAYDHIEGAAEVARKQAHFADDGHIDKDEQKAIDKAHKRQLEQRGRGKSQFKPWRTAKWMARGVKDRMPLGKDKIREPTVQSEA